MGAVIRPCPGCNRPPSVGPDGNPYEPAIVAVCYDCYDGTEDAGELAHLRGHGPTHAEAAADWNEAVQAYSDNREAVS